MNHYSPLNTDVNIEDIDMANYIIDVESHDVKTLIRKLKRLKSTIAIDNYGEYQYCPGYHQVYIESIKTEEELDNWLYLYSNCDYVGVVPL